MRAHCWAAEFLSFIPKEVLRVAVTGNAGAGQFVQGQNCQPIQ